MADSREALILEMRAENELSPEVTKAIQQLDRFDVSAEETAQIFDRAFAKAQARLGAFAEASASSAAEIEGTWRQTSKSIDQLAEQIARSGGNAGNINLDTDKANAAVRAARDKLAALKLLEAAQLNAAAGEGKLTVATEQYVSALRQAIVAQEAEVTSLSSQAGALERLEIELRQVNLASAGFHEQSRRTTEVSGQTRAGMQQLSFQLNDVAVQFAAGTPPMIIFAQQSGQVIQAIQMMSGEAKGFIGFLGGPWGIGITSALVFLTPFVAKLWEGDEAAKAATTGANALASAQSALGGIFDLTSGKLQKQNELLILNARLTAMNLRADAIAKRTSSSETFSAAGRRTAGDWLTEAWRSIDISDGSTRGQKNGKAVEGLIAGLRSGQISKEEALRRTEKLDFGGLSTSKQQVQQAIIDAATAELNDRAAKLIDESLDTGKLSSDLAKPAKTKKGPSAETLAKRAEAARLKLLDQDTAYAEQERQARHKLLDATRKTAESEAMRDQLLREDINAEAAAQKVKIQNQLSSKDISEAQAKHLLDLNERNRQQRLQNLYIQRASETLREQADRQIDDLDQQIAMLRIEQDMASTARERREIGLRLLELEKQKEKIALENIRDDQMRSEEDRARAKRDLDRLDTVYGAKEGQVRDQTAGPMEQYKKRLQDAVGGADQLNESLERVRAEGLQSLEDGLVGVISGTESVGQAFKRMADQIIADLVRIAVQKLIVNQLFGAIGLGGGDSGGGSAGAFQPFTADVVQFATGGRISGAGTGTSDSVPIWASHGEFIVNARSTAQFLPALEAINAGRIPKLANGGLVTPSLPASMRRGTTGGGTSGNGGDTYYLQGNLLTPEWWAEINAGHARAAMAGGEIGYQKVMIKGRRRLS